MIKPDKPANEAQRLDALYRYRILDSEREKSFDDLVVIAKAVCGTSMAAVTLIDVERQWFKSIQGIDATENLRSESMCGHAILQPRELMVVEDAQQDIRFHDNPVVTGDPHVRFYAGAPLISSDGLPLGTLCVFDPTPQHLAPDKAEALAALSRQVMLVMELRRFALDIQSHMVQRDDYERLLSEYHDVLLAQNADLTEQSRTDALTGLPNRRAMAAALQDAVASADGQPRQTCVALVDIDHFKHINDFQGHATGDRVLAELGVLLRSHFAGRGLAARYGGEEFVALMPDVDLRTAELQCEFLRMAVADLPLGFPVTVSIGVAQHQAGETTDQTLARADAALYRAKANGRDRVELAP
ncbi:sensor domain-containing diguanylate cyclase [Stenotrophomonas sp. ZAC14D1_NAIMI4_6]|uniref:sensor domain-containing diguanylate cyclase n=1 Tax=Stenotrophomonas TaxID=40323 RepID=UPI0009A1B34C|nr:MULTISPECIES: sensor domain-containing diguanylate cyclase [Stenotrophomonas]AWH36447.1 sensor domain-containing diguanylate cyclase [Stenotrophomonas sp. ZAC14D1_NAIMI4_6]AWH40637.1 sensor domain-containing diguanylate cyclase [Stenotrophomonas sp. ZAC14D1_NAIMI4_1]MBK0056572.1 sensor domain-containing diguanylate cyclase [Stenotrophomonas sp. S39]